MSEPIAAVCAAPIVEYAEVGSADELEALLRRLAGECKRPVLATVRRVNGDMLSIGLGRPFGVLTYAGAGDEPPYLTSVGGTPPAERVRFDYHGEPSEFGRHNALGLDQAFDVVRAFIQSGGLPLPQFVGREAV